VWRRAMGERATGRPRSETRGCDLNNRGISGRALYMLQNGQDEFSGTLIEPQGVNAGDAIDTVPAPQEKPAGGTPPRPPCPGDLLPEEMVGLPEQRPGYPGQQRSVETG
jgi:hypothetical protein